MIKLNNLDSGGRQIIYRCDQNDKTWDYGSFEDIVAENATPPSKRFPTTNAAAGGIYDHAFILTFFTTLEPSSERLGVGAINNFWSNLNEFVDMLTGALNPTSAIDKVYIALTEIDYVPYFDAGKQYCHIGFDVYVTI